MKFIQHCYNESLTVGPWRGCSAELSLVCFQLNPGAGFGVLSMHCSPSRLTAAWCCPTQPDTSWKWMGKGASSVA